MYLNNKVTQLLNNVLVGNVAWQRAAAILRWPLPTNAACMQEKDAQLLQLTEEKMIVKQFTQVGRGRCAQGRGATASCSENNQLRRCYRWPPTRRKRWRSS